MRNLVAILAFVVFLQARGITGTSNIFKVEIQTADETNANTNSHIIMKMCEGSNCCETWLDNPNKNDFEKDAEDTFGTSYFHDYRQDYCEETYGELANSVHNSWQKTGAQLKLDDCNDMVDGKENCDTFNITNSAPKVTMKNAGNDGWKGESIKITLYNGTTFDYEYGIWIDQDGLQEADASLQSTYNIAEPHAIDNVEVKTRDETYADTDHPIFMEICRGNVYDCCKTRLDNPGINDFEQGETDIFEPSTLNECETFEITSPPVVYMSIEGNNGWLGESVVIQMKTGEIFECPINGWIDGDGERTTIESNCTEE